MSKPIVIAHHLTWTAYGFWLPNDPRGSMSTTIASDIIAELGELHDGRKKIQPAGSVVRGFQKQAKEILKYSVLRFIAKVIDAIAVALSDVINQEKYTCYACAIMPDHIHILIRKHRKQAEEMIENFQSACRLRLSESGHRPPDHPVFASGGWTAFLDHPDEIRRTINYIEQNPEKWKLPQQYWGFVKPYDGWPLHPGHSPNSPYAKRLRECH